MGSVEDLLSWGVFLRRGRDPKETWALIAWVVSACSLHTRDSCGGG